MKVLIFNRIMFHICQLLSIALAFVWFGWKLALIVFFVNWVLNLGDSDGR